PFFLGAEPTRQLKRLGKVDTPLRHPRLVQQVAHEMNEAVHLSTACYRGPPAAITIVAFALGLALRAANLPELSNSAAHARTEVIHGRNLERSHRSKDRQSPPTCASAPLCSSRGPLRCRCCSAPSGQRRDSSFPSPETGPAPCLRRMRTSGSAA